MHQNKTAQGESYLIWWNFYSFLHDFNSNKRLQIPAQESLKPIFENQPPFNPNFEFDFQSIPTAPITSATVASRPNFQPTDLEANDEIEQIKPQKFHTAKKVSAMVVVAFIILGWFLYLVKSAYAA